MFPVCPLKKSATFLPLLPAAAPPNAPPIPFANIPPSPFLAATPVAKPPSAPTPNPAIPPSTPPKPFALFSDNECPSISSMNFGNN